MLDLSYISGNILNLPIENRKKIVDYMEGMPSPIKNYIKLHIPGQSMDQSFFNSAERNVSDYCTFKKYLGKDIKIVSNPQASSYQQEYCGIMHDIYNRENRFTPKTQNRLENILNSDCYDIDTLIRVEVSIGELLNEIKADRELMANHKYIESVASFITNRIMHYKHVGYDLFTYLSINSDIQLREADYSHMTKITSMISRLMKVKSSLTAFSDIGVLIYIYFKDIGMESHIQKYNLFDRFKLAMKYIDISDEYIRETEERLMDCAVTKIPISGAASILINSNKLNKLDNRERSEIPVMTGSPDIDENNGFIFSFKNIKDLDSNLMDELAILLRGLATDEILQYTDINPTNLTFNLSDNDIGHIRNENKINIGTIYNSFSKEIRYIIEKDNEFYLLFKDRMNSRIVYGLSVKKYPSTEDCSLPRKLITIKENTTFNYKYIPEI